jgi:hypothetical protein
MQLTGQVSIQKGITQQQMESSLKNEKESLE